MKNNVLGALAGIALSATVVPAIAQEVRFDERLDAVIDRAIAERRVVGAVVLVAQDGKVIYHRAAGLSDRETATAMKEDAVFRLASITKPIVSATLMRFVERGQISLDDPITRWLPDFRPHLQDGSEPVITVRQLLTHTSGLSYRFVEIPGGPYDQLDISDGLDQPGLSLQENLDRLKKAPLVFRPGTSWRYSLGLDVLGGVIAKVSGRSLPETVKGEVLDPLHLDSMGFVARDRTQLVTPYSDGKPEPLRMTDGIVVPIWQSAARFAPSRALDPASYPSGGAGMVGAAADVLRFLETIRTGGGSILSAQTVAEMVKDQVGMQAQTQGPGWGFGYGWAVLGDPELAQSPQSEGTMQWGGAYGHSWFVDPGKKLTVVALTNTAFEGMSGAFPTDVRNAIYNK